MRNIEIPYGFEYGAAKVTKACGDERFGVVVIHIKTPRHKRYGLQIRVTKTGMVRVFKDDGTEMA